MRWDQVKTLDEMMRFRKEFLSDPGCDVDCGGISSEMDDSDLEEEELLEAWFDDAVGRLAGKEEIIVYRHMTVADFQSFVDGLETGTQTTGAHWSLSEDTWSPAPDQSEIDVLLTGTVRAESVDWFTTFQNFFSYPWESEIAFEGPVRLVSVKDLESGQVHGPALKEYPTLR